MCWLTLNEAVPSKDGDHAVTAAGLVAVGTPKPPLPDLPARLASTHPLALAASAVASEVGSPAAVASGMDLAAEGLVKEEEALAIKAVVGWVVVVSAVRRTASVAVNPLQTHRQVPAAVKVVAVMVGMAARVHTATAQAVHTAIILRMGRERIAVGMAIREEAAHMMTADPRIVEVDLPWTAATVEWEAAVAAIESR